MTVKRRRLLALVMLAAAFGPASAIGAPPNGAKPQVWMGPPGYDNGRCFRELFDKPDAWQQTRAEIDVLLYADHNLKRQFSEDDLRKWFGQLNQWKLKFALEVGAVKPWGQTGEKTFNIQRAHWELFQKLGARLYAIAMDEPLLCCREHIHKPDDYAVEQTAEFIALVRKHFPNMLVGDIETYPSIPLPDHMVWIDALNKKLAAKKVRGLDFYRLDVNWAVFTAFDRGTWPEVRKLEQHCRRQKLPFSLIYWASDYPALKKRRPAIVDDSTWYVSIMRQGYDYALVGGAPDQYVIESWVDGPTRSLPETAPWTFTRSVLDFTRRFAKPGP